MSRTVDRRTIPKPRSRLRKRPFRPDLSIEQILAWADAHFEREGSWPNTSSGAIPETIDDTWLRISGALHRGQRGLPRESGFTLPRLLEKRRGVRNPSAPPDLSEDQIVVWAKLHRDRTGRWPTATSGQVADAPGETWAGIALALHRGKRGLSGKTTLPRLLGKRCRVRNATNLTRLSDTLILKWCDAHRKRTGEWPSQNTGEVVEAPGENWSALDIALRVGCRGLPGGSSVAILLGKKRGRRTRTLLPPLTLAQILAWCDAHHARTGEWPRNSMGPIHGVVNETWSSVSEAMLRGRRGLPAGWSLARLLAKERGVRNKQALPKLTYALILKWCDAHRRRTGEWPTRHAGDVQNTPGETWSRIDESLNVGTRGLPGGQTLAKLLASHRGRRHRNMPPKLTHARIVRWARAYRRRCGAWPTPRSGTIKESSDDTWQMIDNALRAGLRDLPGGSSLAKLLAD